MARASADARIGSRRSGHDRAAPPASSARRRSFANLSRSGTRRSAKAVPAGPGARPGDRLGRRLSRGIRARPDHVRDVSLLRESGSCSTDCDLPFRQDVAAGHRDDERAASPARPAALLRARRSRCVRPGGAIVMVEPWVTPWSALVYTRLHHEPFEPECRPSGSSLRAARFLAPTARCRGFCSAATGRGSSTSFRSGRSRAMTPMMPFRYLVSGGVSLRSLMPGWTRASGRRWNGRWAGTPAGWRCSPGLFSAIDGGLAGRRGAWTELVAMQKTSRIFVAGHRGLVGSGVVRRLTEEAIGIC